MQRISFFLFLVCAAFCVVDCAGGESRVLEARVVDRSYMPAHVDSNGDFVSAEYTLLVQGWGEVEEVHTNATRYYTIREGQTIRYHVRTGWITHHDWSPTY